MENIMKSPVLKFLKQKRIYDTKTLSAIRNDVSPLSRQQSPAVQFIITPIWTYGIELWGCAYKSNIAVIQRCQYKILLVLQSNSCTIYTLKYNHFNIWNQ
jgi:hypothetical protein